MRSWMPILHWVHDNIMLIFFGVVLAMCLVAWLIFEALRSHRSRDEIYRLRQRLYELEREQGFGRGLDYGPVVLPGRWIRTGAAATTSDGGCLILVESASPLQKKAMMTVRVDGLPLKRNATVAVGERMEIDGKSGIYCIELQATETNQARFAVSLRSRHVQNVSGNGA